MFDLAFFQPTFAQTQWPAEAFSEHHSYSAATLTELVWNLTKLPNFLQLMSNCVPKTTTLRSVCS